MRTLLTLMGLVVFVSLATAFAQNQPADERAVREVVQAIPSALSARDWAAAAAPFAEDGDLILPGLPRVAGRDAIRALWEKSWTAANVPQDRRIALTVRSLRFLGRDVAIVDATAEFSSGEPTRDRATYVLIRRGKTWQVAALRVMQAETPAAAEQPAAGAGSVAQVPADLQKTMRERDQAVAKADAATWDRLTADDFTLVDETGTFMTKAQRLAQIKTQQPMPFTAPQQIQIKRYGDSYARRFLSGDLWVLDIWIHDAAGWRVAAVQVTTARKSGAVKVEGATLKYVVEGDGRPCLVVGSSIYYPRTFSKNLRQHLKLIFVDLRHFVPSDGPPDASQITLDTYANDIEAVHKHLRLDKVIVAGHSVHGNIALEYARRYPQNVSQVVIIGSPAVGFRKNSEVSHEYWEAHATEERKSVMRQNWEGKRELVEALPPSERAIKSYLLNGPQWWFDPKYDATWLWQGMEWNDPIRVRLYGDLFGDYDLAQGLRPITTPVFVAMGRYDFGVPYTTWEKEGRKVANLSFNLFEKSGHTPQLEEPAEFDRRLLEWLRKR